MPAILAGRSPWAGAWKSVAMDGELEATVSACTSAHRRLDETVVSVDDDIVRGPSRLPGWTVAHVLAHLARNAESHVRMLDAALASGAVEQYPGGYEQRRHDIEAGAILPADDLRSAVRASWPPSRRHGRG